MMDGMSLAAAELTAALKSHAQTLGFRLAGACPAVAPEGFPQLTQWLERGYSGQMQYIGDRLPAYRHPEHVLSGVRSLLLLALPYRTAEPRPIRPGHGRISRYAWGDADYHDVIHERLKQLIARLRELAPVALARGVVDSAPLLEREFAQLAGLGWVGKHTLLLNRQEGSYFFLAALLTDQELAYDEPFSADHCGSCTACLDACPTQAFPAPHLLDATQCISYLTIELREAVPHELRPGLGDWLFGCDVCQEVCPWNRKPEPAQEPAFAPAAENDPVDLHELFQLDDDTFRRRFRHTPLWRAKRRGILRNAAYVLGNQGQAASMPALQQGLNDVEPLIRGACAWALGRIATVEATQALHERLALETDAEVLEELRLALGKAVPI
jgi:epoxyqueuosine reductase